MNPNNGVTYFARGLVGYQETDIGIAQSDRRYHFLAIGRTGTGKSTLLLSKIIQDMRAGRGLALIDPHGDLAEAALSFVPRERQKHLVYINPTDLDYPVGLNLLEKVETTESHLVAANVISIFKNLWSDSWGPRLEYVLNNTLLALLEHPASNLLWVSKLLNDENFRKRIVNKVNDPVVRDYWEREFTGYSDRFRAEVISPIQNKIGAYLTNRPLRNILGQSKSTIHFSNLINQGHILIANLSKGSLGEEAANLLGSLLVSRIQQAALARANIPEAERRDFYLYIDEYHNFTTQGFASILAEARKYRLNLILAHQYLDQIDQKIRAAVIANTGTIVIFRVGPEDAQVLAKEFGPDWPWSNLVNLNHYEIYYKLISNGKVSEPRQAVTLPSPKPREDVEAYKQKLIEASRRRYSRPRELVERKINNFFGLPKPLLVTAANFETSKKTPVTTFSVSGKS